MATGACRGIESRADGEVGDDLVDDRLLEVDELVARLVVNALQEA
jgi:hypothetical protein